MKIPFRVIEEDSACEKCGLGQTWGILDRNDVLLGESFMDESDAEEMANLLNIVFLDGYKFGREKE